MSGCRWADLSSHLRTYPKSNGARQILALAKAWVNRGNLRGPYSNETALAFTCAILSQTTSSTQVARQGGYTFWGCLSFYWHFFFFLNNHFENDFLGKLKSSCPQNNPGGKGFAIQASPFPPIQPTVFVWLVWQNRSVPIVHFNIMKQKDIQTDCKCKVGREKNNSNSAQWLSLWMGVKNDFLFGLMFWKA